MRSYSSLLVWVCSMHVMSQSTEKSAHCSFKMNEVPPPLPSPLAGLPCPIGRGLDAGGERSSSGEDLANFSQYRHFPPARPPFPPPGGVLPLRYRPIVYHLSG